MNTGFAFAGFLLLAGLAALLIAILLGRSPRSVAFEEETPKQIEPKRQNDNVSNSGYRIKALLRDLDIQHVVVWGHPLNSHTHSYIHEAFVWAAKSLAIDVHWVPVSTKDSAAAASVSYHGPRHKCLFITEGQVVDGLPQEADSWYLFHNVETPFPAIPPNRILAFQFYTYGCRAQSLPVFDEFHRLADTRDTAYMPWATNILPNQFLPVLSREERAADPKHIAIVGQMGPIYEVMIERFAAALPQSTVKRVEHGCTQERMIDMIQHAWCAPALINQWQKDNGYIPCRIMKNISYGAIPVTTSTEAHDMLHFNTICDRDETVLAAKFEDRMKHNGADDGTDMAHKAARLVMTRHTYLNRLEFLLTCLALRDPRIAVRGTKSVLHLTCHRGCEQYIQNVAAKDNWELETIFMPHLAKEFDSVYNVTPAKADQMWAALKDRIQRFAHVLVSDTAPIARIVLQHMDEYAGKVTVWVCNRFNYADGNKENFPDADWPALVNRYHERVRFVSYTKLERVYAIDQGVVWDNAFADAVIRPVYTVPAEPPPVSALPEHVRAAKNDMLFIPPYVNDEKFIPFDLLMQRNIQHYRGKYNGAADLIGFKAVLHVPYAPSNIALFENLSLGLVYYIPSKAFLFTLLDTYPWFSTGNIAQNIETSEWYNPRHADMFVYFDSWDDLLRRLASNEHADKVELVQAWARREEQCSLFQWKLLIC